MSQALESVPGSAVNTVLALVIAWCLLKQCPPVTMSMTWKQGPGVMMSQQTLACGGGVTGPRGPMMVEAWTPLLHSAQS